MSGDLLERVSAETGRLQTAVLELSRAVMFLGNEIAEARKSPADGLRLARADGGGEARAWMDPWPLAEQPPLPAPVAGNRKSATRDAGELDIF